MEIMPWRSRQPSPINSLQSEMNRMLEQLFTPAFAQPLLVARGNGSQTTAVIPAIDVKEAENEIVVTAELPGARREDVEINLQDDILEIRGQKSEEKREERDNYHLVERSYGAFARRVMLPCEVDTATAEARLENGVLTLHLPKAEPKRGKTSISIQGSNGSEQSMQGSQTETQAGRSGESTQTSQSERS
jgi:HSP20 family protein